MTNVDTTLLVHLFGHKGTENLKFEGFIKYFFNESYQQIKAEFVVEFTQSRFMEDLQREVLEIEFNEFSKGMNKITSIEFAEILLRYTDFDNEKRLRLIRKLKSKMDVFSRVILNFKF